MNKSDYLMSLYDALSDIPSEVRTSIINEYKEYFDSELNYGKTEEEIIQLLGDPVTLANEAKQRRGFGESSPNTQGNMQAKRPKRRVLLGLTLLGIGAFLLFGSNIVFRNANIDGFNRGFGETYDIDERKETDLNSINNIEINNQSVDAAISVHTGDKLEVHYKGTVKTNKESYIPKLTVSSSGDTIIIDLKRDESTIFGFYSGNLKLEIVIPEGYDGALNYAGTSSDLEAFDLDIDQLTINITSGDSTLKNVSVKNDLEMNSSSGDSFFNNTVVGDKFDIKSTSGGIRFDNTTSNKLMIQSSSGNVNINEISSKLLEIESLSGDIDITSIDSMDELYLKSTSGNIEIVLSKGLGFEIDSKVTSGRIKCDFDLDNEVSDKNSLKGRYGTGDLKISIRSTSGDIDLR